MHTRLKVIIFILVGLQFTSIQAQTDCTKNEKAQRAKNNMSMDSDGMMCANAAQFYAYLCECKHNPRTAEQARMMKATLEEIKATYNNRGMFCKGIGRISETIPNCKVGVKGDAEKTNAKDESSEMSEAEKFQQSMRNLQNASMMLQESRARAAQVARDLEQFNDVGNSNDPFEIMSRYDYNVQQIDQIQAAFKESATIGNINNVSQVATDYASGNEEGVVYGTIGTIGSIVENQEAKKAIEAQKQALEQKKYEAMLRAANSLIDANTEAQNKWLEAASRALEEDKENYYMEQALYHGSFVNYINSNFSSNHTKWANNPYKKPEKPFFRKERGNLAELHYRAAKRKQKLYEKHNNNEILYEGIIMHLSAAIDEDPKNFRYYLELAHITNPSDLVLSLQSYLTAYELNANAFTIEDKIAYNKLRELVSQDIAKLLSNQDEARLREYIDAGLYSVLRVKDQTPWEIAMEKDFEQIVSIIYHEEMPHLSDYEQQEKIQSGILHASQFGSIRSLDFLYEEGEILEFKRGNKTPLAIASEFQQLEAFRYLLFKSANRKLSQQPFNNSAILIYALVEKYPEEATEQLCGIKEQTTLENTIRELLNMVNAGIANNSKGLYGIQNTTPTKEELMAYVKDFKEKHPEYAEVSSEIIYEGIVSNYSTDNKDLNVASSFTASSIEKSQLAKVIGNCSQSKKAILKITEFQSIIQDNFLSALDLHVNQSSEAQRAIYYLEHGLISEDFLKSNKSRLTVNSIRNDNHEVLKWLQESNYDVLEDKNGLPISHHFVEVPQNIIKAGLYRKYSFDNRDKDGVPFIHKLIFSGKSTSFLSSLIKENLIDINQEGMYGWTALHYAARENKVDLVNRLVALGANKKAKDKWGRTPYRIAKERKFKDLKVSLK